MSLASRIQKVHSYAPSREEWQYRLEQSKKFPNNPDGIGGIQSSIWAEVANEVAAKKANKEFTDSSISDVMNLFIKILNENFPEYLPLEPGAPLSKFDTMA